VRIAVIRYSLQAFSDTLPTHNDVCTVVAQCCTMLYNVVRCCTQILDLSLNPLGVNGGRLVADLVNPSTNHHQFLVELRLNKVCAGSGGVGVLVCGKVGEIVGVGV